MYEKKFCGEGSVGLDCLTRKNAIVDRCIGRKNNNAIYFKRRTASRRVYLEDLNAE